MGTTGEAYDNAMCESFFATLQCELIDRTTFKNREEAQKAVFEFIEGWYNPHRRHSALSYDSPLSYEKKYSNSKSPIPPQNGVPRAMMPATVLTEGN